VAAFVLFFLSLTGAWLSLVRVLTITGLIRNSSIGAAVTVLNSNAASPATGAPVKIGVWLLVGIIGAFLVGQAVAAIYKTWLQRKALTRNPVSILHRAFAISVISIIGAGLVFGMAVVRFPHGSMGWDGVGFLLLIFLAFQIGRALLIDFIVGFFGDVQVYTTRDENDSKFYAMRDRILDTAVTAIMRAVSPSLNGGRRYDRVVVLGHSLGATIATDAITRVAQVCKQGALTREEFDRIRSFVMLGSPLEKTSYFFDVAGIAPSASYQAWRGPAYYRLFSADPALIAAEPGSKIFWINYWYFQDPICDQITSYRDICRNEQGKRQVTLADPLIHSDYLNDPWFWLSSEGHIGALDVITAKAP
jgi:pimeloyl-ACP methyl ester carboxylesterase